MSTRCQVKVVQSGTGWEQAVTLYHHYDGYPSKMVPLIASAFSNNWEHGRAGKVASFLCAVDPGGFEPEEGHEIHGDIDYYYILTVDGKGGSIASKPSWHLQIFGLPYYKNMKLLAEDDIFKLVENEKTKQNFIYEED